jgi:hypothetical protein
MPGGATVLLAKRLTAPAEHSGRLRATTVVIASAVLLAGCAGGAHAPDAGVQGGHRTDVVPTGANVTVLRTFTPFGPDGAPAAGVAAHRSGSCFTNSITVAKRNAYRCFAGNDLLDPCFARSRAAKNVFCYANPWSKATRLRLTKPLGSTVGSTKPLRVTRPWAIRLHGGLRCIATGGTTDVVRGVALSYRCGNAGTAGLHPVHHPGRHAQRTALFSGRSGALHDVDVAVEWRA